MAENHTDLLELPDHGALFDVLTATAADGIIVIDESARILFYNGACQRLFQYSSQDIIGKNIKILMPMPYRNEHDGYVARYKKTHEPRIIGIGRKVQGQRKDGSIFPMYLSVGEGEISGNKLFVGIIHDLTSIQAEEDRRDASDRHLAQIVETSDDIILSKTLDGIVTSWNPAAERIFGYPAFEMIGQSISRIIPPERQSEEDEILARVRKGESVSHFETTRLRKDGTTIIVSLSVSPVRDGNGEIVGASKIARDITEHRRSEAQAARLAAELAHVSRVSVIGQLSSALAHELNQPLTAIMNYVSTVKLKWKAAIAARDEQVPALLDRALDQAERAGAIIQRLRSFLEKREPDRASQNINTLINEALALGFVGSSDDGVKLHLDLSGDLPEIEVDRVQIGQVIVNLVRNASEAMRVSPVRELKVSSYKAGPKQVEISISDTGPGIPADVAAKLFEPFVTTKETGMGIGLSICRTIIEAHGGRIWMVPDSPTGTSFRIQLPVNA